MKKFVALTACAALGVLWIPPPVPEAPAAARQAFVWDATGLFKQLESRYAGERTAQCPESEVVQLVVLDRLVDLLRSNKFDHRAPIWEKLEAALFEAALVAATCPAHASRLTERVPQVQEAVRKQVEAWDLRKPEVLARVYRTRYGLRAAYEEVLLQTKRDDLVLTRGETALLAVPKTTLHGVTIQSGDILVSRGGAPTSALIARGNDRPGNFSHVALVHVDAQGKASVVESHIESGVGVFSAAQYLRDKKLRIMVLRLVPTHTALGSQRDLPHRASQHALDMARSSPPGYDFAMDYKDPTQMFCSEVVYDAYLSQGVRLWKALSSLSGPASGRWLAALGVEHFETLAPSDLEYDPQLRIVAEWRNPETLFDDHMDNAIIDALLERAGEGLDLDLAVSKLGIARLAKAYSVVLGQFGKQGPIPAGMSAAAALRVARLRELHGALRPNVEADAEAFERKHGYRPPYWELVHIARQRASSISFD